MPHADIPYRLRPPLIACACGHRHGAEDVALIAGQVFCRCDGCRRLRREWPMT